MIIHLHFHIRTTGVTRSIENIIPYLSKYNDAAVFGYGINTTKIRLFPFFRSVFSRDRTILHAHRVNEMIFAIMLRSLGGRFKLFCTRHSESRPAPFTCRLIKRADQLVSLSPAMAANLPLLNTMIRHGIDTEIFKIREKRSIRSIPQQNLISVIGRIRPAKGQLTVMTAALAVLKENHDWGLVFIGRKDDKKYSAKILSTAREHGILPQVHIMPETWNIISYYTASDIVVIASEIEGFSLVCLEAMASGLTTVATENVGIHSEVIRHGENGFLFPVNDTVSLTRIISDIISKQISLDPGKIRQTIIENWSVEKSARELLDLYNLSLSD